MSAASEFRTWVWSLRYTATEVYVVKINLYRSIDVQFHCILNVVAESLFYLQLLSTVL